MTIERMGEGHIAGVKALLDDCFGSSAWSEASIRSQLGKTDSVCTVAVDDGIVVAYLAFELIAGEGSVIELAVSPGYRRRGIATELIENALSAAEGLSEVFLEVRESNAPAVKLYEKLGFEAIGVRRDYYDSPKENAVIMRKRYEDTRDRKQL